MAVNPGINTIVGFNVNSATPIDNRMVVADAAALAALVSPYVGLVTYQVDTGVSYIYNGSTWIDEKVGLVSATSSGGVTYSIPYWSSHQLLDVRIQSKMLHSKSQVYKNERFNFLIEKICFCPVF